MTALNQEQEAAANEEVARIIDPVSFRSWQSLYDYCVATGDGEEWARDAADGFHLKSMNEARDKARQIIAHLQEQSAS